MTAVWLAEVEAAMARGSSAGATMPGTSASMEGISNARAVPVTNTRSRMVSRPSHPAARADRQHGGGERADELAGPRDDLAVEVIDRLPDQHRQRHRREELHEADQPEVERAVGQCRRSASRSPPTASGRPSWSRPARTRNCRTNCAASGPGARARDRSWNQSSPTRDIGDWAVPGWQRRGQLVTARISVRSHQS